VIVLVLVLLLLALFAATRFDFAATFTRRKDDKRGPEQMV